MLNNNKQQIQDCKVQKVKAADASSGDTYSSRFIIDNGNAHSLENDCSKTRNDQILEKRSSTPGNKSSRPRNECSKRGNSDDNTDIRPSYDIEPMAKADQKTNDNEDERVVLANLIANLKLDINENKMIQKQSRKANATLTHEQNECKLPDTASGSKSKPRNYNQQTRNWPPSMSWVTNNVVHIAEKPRNLKPIFKSKYLACPASKKCLYTANHDACILKYLLEIPIGQRFSLNKSFAVYVKTTPPRFGLIWKPTGKIFTYVGLRWIPTRNMVETYINTNDSNLPLGKETRTPNIVICANSSSLSACTSVAFEPISSKGSTNVAVSSSLGVLKQNDDGSTSSVIIKQHRDILVIITSKYDEYNAFALEDLILKAGNPIKEILLKMNLPDHRRRCSNHISSESNSLPHAHTQATKTYYKHQDSRIKKAKD
nr:hypothetical protein [Tanacetum cinerariifolium]